jgi:hypothetical protein
VASLLSGGLIMAYLIVSLFFLKLWRKSQDKLLLIFSGAFGLMALEKILQISLNLGNEALHRIYFIRFAAFSLIIIGVFLKNREPSKLS